MRFITIYITFKLKFELLKYNEIRIIISQAQILIFELNIMLDQVDLFKNEGVCEARGPNKKGLNFWALLRIKISHFRFLVRPYQQVQACSRNKTCKCEFTTWEIIPMGMTNSQQEKHF